MVPIGGGSTKSGFGDRLIVYTKIKNNCYTERTFNMTQAVCTLYCSIRKRVPDDISEMFSKPGSLCAMCIQNNTYKNYSKIFLKYIMNMRFRSQVSCPILS